MFKEENRIWWYIVGLIIGLIGITFFAKDYLIPIILGQRTLFGDRPFLFAEPPDFALEANKDYFARFKTNEGVITVDLLENAAPVNVNNFIFLSNQEFYNSTKFHRIVPDFLVQGGDRNSLDDDPANDGLGNPGYFIEDEVNWDSLELSEERRAELESRGYRSASTKFSQPLERFTLAMANTQPNTNGSQFFFVTASTSDLRLDKLAGQFTVIGKLAGGADVLETLSNIDAVDIQEDGSGRLSRDIEILEIEIFTIDLE